MTYAINLATATGAVIAGALVAALAPHSVPTMFIACGLSGAGFVTGFYNTLIDNIATIRAALNENPDFDYSGWMFAYGLATTLSAVAVSAVWLKAVFG